MSLTAYHAKLFAHELTKRSSSDNVDKLASALSDAQVDLNPHQIEAALFAFRSPLSKGAILADEVGLGKTIEAGILLAQHWAERVAAKLECPDVRKVELSVVVVRWECGNRRSLAISKGCGKRGRRDSFIVRLPRFPSARHFHRRFLLAANSRCIPDHKPCDRVSCNRFFRCWSAPSEHT